MALSRSQKDSQLKGNPHCYVCNGLNLQYSTFDGYHDSDIQFDHYRAKSLVGDKQEALLANQLPIHSAKNGDDFRSPNFEKSTKRNCHAGKGNFFTGEEWVDYVRIYRRSLGINYSDDLFVTRSAADKKFEVDISWDEENQTAGYGGGSYPIMEQKMENGETWVSFSTVIQPSLLWVDQEVQSRPADKARMAELAWHLRSNPLLSPILCRYSNGKLKVFDGNHRLCAFVLARENHPVPVTIFKGPEPLKFLEVVAEAHDKLTQKKYQYSDKAMKFSGISEAELADVVKKHGNEASEVKAWEGLTKKDVKLRLIGRVSQAFESAGMGWRQKWKTAGLTDASFAFMIEYYSLTEALAKPLSASDNFRESEITNLKTLFSIFDQELFDKLDKFKNAKASLKTKWWKLAHKRLRMQLSQLVKNAMKLQNTPEKPAYSPEWDNYISSQLRSAVTAWRDSPVWAGNTTANNEPDVDDALMKAGFTESYLFS